MTSQKLLCLKHWLKVQLPRKTASQKDIHGNQWEQKLKSQGFLIEWIFLFKALLFYDSLPSFSHKNRKFNVDLIVLCPFWFKIKYLKWSYINFLKVFAMFMNIMQLQTSGRNRDVRKVLIFSYTWNFYYVSYKCRATSNLLFKGVAKLVFLFKKVWK